VEFFTSHEGLNLLYESAQTRRVPRRPQHYDLTTHMPWIGERTRALDGAHVEFFRGIANPVGVKIGPGADPAEVVELTKALNPANEPGKLVLIVRMGADRVATALPPIVEAVVRADRRGLWVSDPMHGNGIVTPAGIKTRSFNAIAAELSSALDAFESFGNSQAGKPVAQLGGVHFELTGEDVTECTGGASGITEDSLGTRYDSLCDPRLNYQQSLELALILARRLSDSGRA
ncbi:MAG: 3-deoxy-7-phosphoheptulonate synthase, partial [Salinibacterium sp.]|nr:3-deoxy-7-phosphoheptulonate synthase [Salinibacterium sp.]